MFPMIVSVGMCDLLRSGNLRVMEVHDQTLALSSIAVDLEKDLGRWLCAPEIWVGEKERVARFRLSNPISHPKRKNSAI